jgi:hypothetical protein
LHFLLIHTSVSFNFCAWHFLNSFFILDSFYFIFADDIFISLYYSFLILYPFYFILYMKFLSFIFLCSTFFPLFPSIPFLLISFLILHLFHLISMHVISLFFLLNSRFALFYCYAWYYTYLCLTLLMPPSTLFHPLYGIFVIFFLILQLLYLISVHVIFTIFLSQFCYVF